MGSPGGRVVEDWMWWAAGAALLVVVMFRQSTPAGANLSPAQVQDWMTTRKDLQLIDVRTPGEYAQGHLQGAQLLPLGVLRGRIKSLDPGRPLVVYCLTGSRSGQAVKIL